MTEYYTATKAAQMRKRLSGFLTRSLDDLTLGWPRRSLPRAPEAKAGASGGRPSSLKALIIGELVLELPVEVEGTRGELLALLRSGRRDRMPSWRMSELRLGGFVAHAARASVALGAEVSVCTFVPVPTPGRFESFFDELAIDRGHVSGLPGPCPVSIIFCCKDGQVTLRRPSILNATCVGVPTNVEAGFDVVLADTCHLGYGGANVHLLLDRLRHTSNSLVVGLRIDPRWNCGDLAVTHDDRVWAFVRYHDARQLAARIAKAGVDGDEDSIAECLHDEGGVAKLVLQLGPRGAVLLNGIPCPYHVQACPMDSASSTGAGHTLLTITTLSSALGADDRTSLRRGVAAATGQVAGLDPPVCLEELDAA